MALTPQFGSLVPPSTQQILASNYLQFNTGAGSDFAQQYLPEIRTRSRALWKQNVIWILKNGWR